MPRHESSSVEILNDLLTSVYVQVITQQNAPELYSAELQRRFDDIGRLADVSTFMPRRPGSPEGDGTCN